MQTAKALVDTVNDMMWGLPMLLILGGTHLFMTWRTSGIQRKLPLAIRLSFSRENDAKGDVSPFASLSTALASTLGTGNIIGIGTAIALGGPGAVFWCWITGIFGIATAYAESLIAIKYRVQTQDGRYLGGAMYVLEKRLHLKPLAVAFACFGALAGFGVGCGVQVNAIAVVLNEAVMHSLSGADSGLSRLLAQRPDALSLAVGIVTGLITCIVIFGGVRSISKVCERLVPFMALFYLGGCGIILWINRAYLGAALLLILRDAFGSARTVAGGLTGSGMMLALRYGVARGLATNEAGMGSAPIVAAAARTSHPVRQALISSTATFWDTVVVCLLTGLVLVSTLLSANLPGSGMYMPSSSGGDLTTLAFAQIPHIGQPLLVVSIICFAYATILGWSYYGERCLEYLFGHGSFFIYRFLWILVLVFAPVLDLSLMWSITDVLNALMALPNLAALWLLSGDIARETRHYFK